MTKSRTTSALLAVSIGVALSTAAPALAHDHLDGPFIGNDQPSSVQPKLGDALTDLPAPPKSAAPKTNPGPPNKALGGPDTKPPADGGRWDFKKDSTFVLGDGTKLRKGPALRTR